MSFLNFNSQFVCIISYLIHNLFVFYHIWDKRKILPFLASVYFPISDPIGNYYHIRLPQGEGTFAGIQEGSDQIQTIVNDGQKGFVNKTSFIIQEGLCGTPGYVSIESSAFPGKFWRHSHSNVKLQDKTDDDLFIKDACWRISKGNCDINQLANSVSFFSFNFQDQLITKCGNHLKIESDSGGSCGGPENACWILEHKHGLFESF